MVMRVHGTSRCQAWPCSADWQAPRMRTHGFHYVGMALHQNCEPPRAAGVSHHLDRRTCRSTCASPWQHGCTSSGSNAQHVHAAEPTLEAWPTAGDNYCLQRPGSYRLSQGDLAQVTRAPCLLVSDLDDTMVGDDEATAQFRDWWQREAIGNGARLVYNTGRALVRSLPWHAAGRL